MGDYAQMLSSAIAAVAAACRVTRAVQGNMSRVAAIIKDDRSPVTIADYASQGVVAHVLRARLRGDLFIVGEETSAYLRNPEHAAVLAATVEAAREGWDDVDEQSLIDAIDLGAADPSHQSFWTLDPIDGTKGFVRGEQYAISLSLIEGGQPVIGVLGCPNLARDFTRPMDRPDRHGTIYSAIRGEGCYELPAEGAEKAHAVRIARPVHDLAARGQGMSVCTSVDESHTHMGKVEAVMDVLAKRGIGMGEPLRLDGQGKYAVVARGQADAYLRLPTKKDYVEFIWDHAAGSLIAAEAGVAVTDVHGRGLDFSRGRRLEQNRGIIAAAPGVHGAVIAALAEIGI